MNHSTILVLITVLISIISWQNNKLFDAFIFHPQRINKGELHRFITYGFIHSDGKHLLFNMITLFFFGKATESFFNHYVAGFGFVVFYIFALVASIVPTYLNEKNNLLYRGLGASGAVSAILFASVLMGPWHLIFVYFIPIPAIIFAVLYVGYEILQSKKGDSNINHSAHLWGAAFGVVGSIAINPNLIFHFANAFLHPRLF